MAVKKNECVEFAMLSEMAYRTFLDLIKNELDSAGIIDINPIQAFVLLNINDNKITMGDIIQKGYYAGSNASYNLKKMNQNGYIHQAQSTYDKRTQFVNITDKGKSLLDLLNSKIQEHASSLENSIKDKINLGKVNGIVRNIDNHWKSRINLKHRI